MAAHPLESHVVTFFEMPVLAVRLDDGTIYLSVRDLCDAVGGLDRANQLARIRADEDLREGLQTVRVTTAGGPQAQAFLELELVPTWISTVDRARAAPQVRERLRYLRRFSIRQTYDTIAQAAGLPAGPSRQIEDLRDLHHLDEAITGIAARQQALEESQARARQAWQEHEARLRQLEAHLALQGQTLSSAQAGQVYHLVHEWAHARADQEGIEFAKAISGCWAALKTRYRVAKYEHIGAAAFDDCVAYLTQAIARLTGPDHSGAQLRLDLDEP